MAVVDELLAIVQVFFCNKVTVSSQLHTNEEWPSNAPTAELSTDRMTSAQQSIENERATKASVVVLQFREK